MTTYTTCPACHYTRKPTDDVPEWECPNCQKVYDKAVQALNTEPEKLKSSCTNSVAVAKPITKKAADSVSLRFADPVSEQTEWSPMNEQLSGFHRFISSPTYKLLNINSARIEFKTTILARFACVFDLIMGMVFLGFLTFIFSLNSFKLDLVMVAIIIIAICAAVFGVLRIYNISMPLVFDKSIGFFWKGKTSPCSACVKGVLKHSANLEEIHAIQLISDFHPSNSSSNAYYSYEMNLILIDGRRLNLDANMNMSAMREQADTLSRFLGKPVWDASNLR
jgi:hypothetical protein